MIDALLAQFDSLLLALFAVSVLAGAVAMLVLRTPMHVALALISTMVFLGGIYGLLGVHFIAAFQVLIYVGAVMVFMIYVIMLLDARDAGRAQRYSRLAVPAVAGLVVLAGSIATLVAATRTLAPAGQSLARFGLKEFAATFLSAYWLQFELISVLLVTAVIAALAVIRVNRRHHG